MTVDLARTSLLRQLPERQVVAGQAFELRRRVWNGVVDRHPAVIVRPESVDDVATAVRIARQSDLPLSVRGGGHDWSGQAIRPGGLVVDMDALRSVTVDGDVATVAGGATSDDVLKVAREHGMAAALGTVASVGAVGLILGGGYSPLIGVTGLGVDNLLSAEVVLADGSVVTADAEHEPDLFWALRGGGGNFGVVTSMRIRLHPIADVTAGMIAFSRTGAEDVLRNLQRLHESADDALDVMFGAMHGPDGPMVFTSPTWAGPAEAGQAQVDRVRALGAPIVDEVARRPLAEQAHALDEIFPAGAHYRLGTRIVAGITEEFVDVFMQCFDDMPVTSWLNVHHAHGAALRVPSDATAHAYRNPHLVVEILGMWRDGDGRAETEWVEATERRLDAVAEPGGWTNLMHPDDPRAADAYGDNRSRLMAVKAAYDPDDVFRAIPLPW